MDNDTMVAVSPEDREAAAALVLADGNQKHRAERIMAGSHDEAPLVQAFARHRHQSGRTGAGEALDKRIFLSCVSGDGPTPYLKVHFNTLADAHAAHDQLLGRKGDI